MSTVICSRCNKTGHNRSNNRKCEFYQPRQTRTAAPVPQNRPRKCRSQFAAIQAPFVEQMVTGKDVVDARHQIAPMKSICPYCNAHMFLQEKTGGTLSHPTFSLCCSKGMVIIPDIKPAQEIIDLIGNDNRASKEILKNIRKYNSSLSFTSCATEYDRALATGRRGVYTFRIHGSVYHSITSLFPSGNESPRFCQIYICDPEEQLSIRYNLFRMNMDTLRSLQDLLHAVNPFCQTLRSIRERVRLAVNDECDVRMILRSETSTSRRQYHLPTASEVAVILPNHTENAEDLRRHIVIETRTGALQTINELNWSYDPLHYVLIFPHGDKGWSQNSIRLQLAGQDAVEADAQSDQSDSNAPVAKRQRTHVTAMQFYSHRLQVRYVADTQVSWMHLFGRLTHQFVVDMYAKIEGLRLKFIRFNQDKIRADLYQGVVDAISSESTSDASSLGRRTVLPSSFTGCPRHMHQLYQDSLSVTRHFGKPDLFITFTCNPAWPEIKTELQGYQTASDRPDLCVRVFKIKLTSLMEDLLEKQIFGIVVAHLHVVEFQKRGLPHAHILLILDSRHKPRPDNYDNIISAELPDQRVHPLAYATVSRMMMHGPCGIDNPDAPCMQDGHCSKRFPKSFNAETTTADGGFPIYRRRNNGASVNKSAKGRRIPLDNRWVIPHNLWLCTKYNAHINVEICSTIVAVKYLFKYVYKGHDRADVNVEETNPPDEPHHVDEIRQFVDARYISASECYWRIFDFRLHGQSPNCVRLQIHLPNMQPVRFLASDDPNEILLRNNDSMLMAWFSLNQTDPEARQILYPDIPTRYTWSAAMRKWRPRKNASRVLGRLYFVHPTDMERYCLRMLLLNVPGATSFKYLRTVDGTLHPTFQSAALALDLLEDDDEWDKCMVEASEFRLPRELRRLFVVLLLSCNIADPEGLWSKHRMNMTEDFLHRAGLPSGVNIELTPENELCALRDIDSILRTHGKSLCCFPSMPQLPLEHSSPTDELPDFVDAESFEINAQRHVTGLNSDQRHAFNQIIAALDPMTRSKRLFFVDGPAGTGKSFLYNTLIEHVTSVLGKTVLPVASSGIAALILHGGRTAHSMLKIPIQLHDNSVCNIRKQSTLAKKLRAVDLLIWDEAPMMHKFAFEAVDRTLRDITDIDEPFGGKVVVMGGDFRQILPVVPKGTKNEIAAACIKYSSSIWPYVHILRLSQNMRVSDDADRHFAEYLLRVGDGLEPTVSHSNLIDLICLPSSMVLPTNFATDDLAAILLRQIYRDLDANWRNPDYIVERAVLTPRNCDVNSINVLATAMFPGEETVFLSQDAISNPNSWNAALYPVEFLNTLEPPGMPPHSLRLKLEQPIMLLRNIAPANGLCNGTRLICKNFSPHLIEAEIMTGKFQGNHTFIPRIPFNSGESDLNPVMFSRRQFPIRPAFAMTINKAQGQTLKTVGVYLPEPVFCHGQLYVALSRCTNSKGVNVAVKEGGVPHRHGVFTRNVVYRNVL